MSNINNLEVQLIQGFLSARANDFLLKTVVYKQTASTNNDVLDMRGESSSKFVACIAEQQTAGRGRNGRVWQSPADANVYLSVGGHFDPAASDKLSGLSLACGVAVARMLESEGVSVMIKWPNDIVVKHKKLAGLLIETRVKAQSLFAVIGIGLNVNMPEEAGLDIDQPWTDLKTCYVAEDKIPDRNYLVASLINALVDCCVEYRSTGFESFKGDWNKFDLLMGRQVTVKTAEDLFEAEVTGLDENFALQVRVGNKVMSLHAADISIRLNNADN